MNGLAPSEEYLGMQNDLASAPNTVQFRAGSGADGMNRSGSFPPRASLWSTIDLRALLLALGTFAIGTDAFIIGGILPEIARDLSASIGKTGLVVSVFSLSYALGSPIISALSARWRRSTVMVGGLTVFSVANLLSALSPTLACLLATRVVAALAAGLVAPASYALASTLGSYDNRGKTLAIVAAGFTSAIVVGVPLGVFIGKYAGWRGSLVFVAILGAIAALSMFSAGVPEPDSPKGASSLSEQLRIVSRPKTIFLLTPFLIWSIANFGLYTFIAAILGRHLSATAIPLLLLLFGLGGMTGNFIGGALSDRYGTRWPTIICLLMLICALATIEPASSSIVAASVTMIWWAICMAALFTLQQQRAIAANPKQSNLALALNNSALYLGASVGAAAGGVVISRISLAFLAPASAAAAALGLLALLVLPQSQARAATGLPNDKIEPRSRVESSVPNAATVQLRDR
jgi:MFS transporter, DHA1 family, inner membrane transport protein